ncbi:MAG: hypothetical protein NTW98_03350, partial [Candidatus Nomurabacteria bacterium]|nr:hypothetical protein [Candidatus Nomurabacteria bacterium]
MEQNFQTSFIPKKPIVQERSTTGRPTGFFLVIAIFIFLSMVAAAGGVYFYKSIVDKNISEMEKNLNIAKNRFEPSKITQLQTLDRRLKASNEILGKHIAVSPIFKALSEITMKSVRYTKFGYDVGTSKESRVVIKLSGQAQRYSSIALQSDLFKKNKNLIDPVFSNLALDEKGNVLFDLEFSVDPNFVDYKQTVETEAVSGLGGGSEMQST